MLSTDSSSVCGRAETLRDYVFDELPANERGAIEQHLFTCDDCATELDRLRLTTAALRTLPDREIPQRIAFVSDRVFEPSVFRRFWNSGARLGFASACVLAMALVVSAVNHRADVSPVVQTVPVPQQQIDAAVAKAVAQVRVEDAKLIQAAVQASDKKHDLEYRNQMAAVGESFDYLRKTLNVSYAKLGANDGAGVGQ
jgi:anti-sigma factor RsiW